MPSTPTQETYAELQRAYDHFNGQLFGARLPRCMIVLQRQHDTYGYFSANQFQSRASGEQTHEIALNPSYFAVRPIPETLSVLVREMVSLDQTLNSQSGKLPRRRYRNREWADMAEAIGLMPSDTGMPGGKRVGDSVQTYIIDGGKFDAACSVLVNEAFTLSWVDRFPPKVLPGATLAKQAVSAAHSAGEGAQDGLAGAEPEPAEDNQFGTYEAGDQGGVAALQADDGDEVAGAPTYAPGDNPAGEQVHPAPDKPVKVAPPMKHFEPVSPEALRSTGIEPKEATKSSKNKFTCGVCAASAWGKPSLRIGCYGKIGAEHEPAMMAAV